MPAEHEILPGWTVGGQLAFEVPVATAYDYLADPRTRPQWQSSLRSVDLLDQGPPRAGMRWRDRTKVGIVPEMTISVMEPGRLWMETGRWWRFTAVLLLTFAPRPGGCSVDYRFAVRAGGLLRPAGWLASLAGLPAVRADLRKASRLLATAGPRQAD